MNAKAGGHLNFVELFAGAGGLSEGFVRTGFQPVAFVEQDKHCCETLKTRHAFYQLKQKRKLPLYYNYLRGKIDKQTLYQKAAGNEQPAEKSQIIQASIGKDNNSIIQNIQRLLGKSSLDVIIGGPPCQAYSIIGRPQNRKKNIDERCHLYKDYAAFLKALQPKAFVFENVLGLLSFQQGQTFQAMQDVFREAGYSVFHNVYNVADFNVPQNRKRIIIVGFKCATDTDTDTEAAKTAPLLFKSTAKKSSFTINELFKDLPHLQANETAASYKASPCKKAQRLIARTKQLPLTCHQARSHHPRDLIIYSHARRFWQQGKRLRYSELPPKLRTHKNTDSFLDRFKVVAGNSQQAHTILAHISKDGHYYIHPDSKQNRSLTVREAARIQSFPDNFFFEGPRTAQFIQVGNAVPPLFSAAIARQILGRLNGTLLQNPLNAFAETYKRLTKRLTLEQKIDF